MNSRRQFLQTAAFGAMAVTGGTINSTHAAELITSTFDKKLTVESLKIYEIKVNQRGNWIFVELLTNKGIKGIGEASHAVSYATANGSHLVKNELNDFFRLAKGESPFDIEQYRQRGLQKAQTGKLPATAFSAIEQSLWDIVGKATGIPSYQFFGGKVRDKIRVYANINRATNERDMNGRRLVSDFQKNAEIALKEGFNALKLAPFDEMKPLSSSNPTQIREDIDYAVRCIEKIRNTVGNKIDLLIDVHSRLNQPLGIEVAKQVEPFNLFWFEEPVDPEQHGNEMKAITASTEKQTAGGESIFGRIGFYPLITEKTVDILMPDVKHCGGVQEFRFIAALAETAGIKISPHNPSGPVSTAVNVALCTHIPNFSILEYAQGEVEWREKLITPVEEVNKSYILVNNRPGWGYELNYTEIEKHL